MPPASALSSGQSLLILDDQPALLKDVDGGNITGEVESLDMGPQRFRRKHISRVKFEPFTIEVGLSMGKPLAEWIAASLDLSQPRKSGSVVSASADNKAKGYRHFRDALIDEITIPAMDASSKEAAFFRITFQAEEITHAKGDDAIRAVVNTKQKKWLRSNFRLVVGDLPCARVSKVDAFSIEQIIVENQVGAVHGATLMPTSIEFPNLKVTFSAADVGPWQEWFTEFVINGHNDTAQEVQGSLEFLDPASQEPLGSIELSQIGIFALNPEKQEANKDAVARYVAELYMQKMTINLKNV